MAFIDQVQDLTSLTVSDNDELSQFLKDGVLDVTNRWLAMRPQDIQLFGRESSETTSNASLNLNGARIISVIREDGTNNQWRNCRKISPALQYDVTDVDSLNYASKINPAYMIGDAGKISVFPTPGADPNAFKAYYVNKDPVNGSGSALIHSHDDILYFPIDKVYLVVMYAGMRSLHAAMGATTITDLTVTVVPPDVPLLASTSLSFSQAAPTYTKPTISLTAAPTIGNLTISVSAPTAPSLSTITFSSIDSAITSTLVQATTSDTLTGATSVANVPTYTKPTATGGAGLTGMEAGTIADATDQIEFDTWWDTLGDLIETQEDTELAAAQLQKIQAYIQAYSAEIQNELNEFNKENVKFQASVQESMAEFQSANQMAIADAERSQNRQLQNSANDMKAIFDNNTQAIQKYQAEIQSYQQSVADQVQEYQQNLAGDLQVWQAERTTDLQQYTTDIQNELNEFNKENAAYQAQLQVSIQNAQLENQDEQFKVQKYQAEYAGYTAEVNEQVQAYTQNLQADGVGYQWLQDQYNRLKAEYDAAFMIAAPKQQPAPARR
jgi:hypothetical protein